MTTPATGNGTGKADSAAHSRLVRRAVEILCSEEGTEPRPTWTPEPSAPCSAP